MNKNSLMLNHKFVLIGLVLEVAAFSILFQEMSVEKKMFGFFILHAAASVDVAQMGVMFLPENYRQPKWAIYGLFFITSFFVPLLCYIFVSAVVITARFYSKPVVSHPFLQVELPEFTLGSAGVRNSLGEGAIRTRLNTPSLSTEVRMKALLSAHAMSARYSVPILKELLGDEADDLRLLAYGMLDNREKSLNTYVDDTLKKLASCTQPSLCQLYQKQLAELYWTFAYEHLAEGDMLAYMLMQAEHYARTALAVRLDGDLLVLLAQILIKQEKIHEVEAVFDQAIQLGMPAMRIQPYLAELAFQRQDYHAVREHLKLISFNNQIPQIANIQQFWLRING
jgi:polysaccharide biosynthesis protein PelE